MLSGPRRPVHALLSLAELGPLIDVIPSSNALSQDRTLPHSENQSVALHRLCLSCKTSSMGVRNPLPVLPPPSLTIVLLVFDITMANSVKNVF